MSIGEYEYCPFGERRNGETWNTRKQPCVIYRYAKRQKTMKNKWAAEQFLLLNFQSRKDTLSPFLILSPHTHIMWDARSVLYLTVMVPPELLEPRAVLLLCVRHLHLSSGPCAAYILLVFLQQAGARGIKLKDAVRMLCSPKPSIKVAFLLHSK